MNKILIAYLETALWASTDDQDLPLTGTSFSPEAVAQAERTIEAFLACAPDLTAHEDEQIGHDLWLTQNRHGAGFWDGAYEQSLGEALTRLAHSLGEVDVYVGDDGLAYFSGGLRK